MQFPFRLSLSLSLSLHPSQLCFPKINLQVKQGNRKMWTKSARTPITSAPHSRSTLAYLPQFLIVFIIILILIIIIIIKNNINRSNSHGQHGSKRRKQAQHTHSPGSNAVHSHTYINTVITSLCEAPAQPLQNLESFSFFFFKVPEGGGANPLQPAR